MRELNMKKLYNLNEIESKLNVININDVSLMKEFNMEDKINILQSIKKLSLLEILKIKDTLILQVYYLRHTIEHTDDLDIHCIALGNLDEFIIPIGKSAISILDETYDIPAGTIESNSFFMS